MSEAMSDETQGTASQPAEGTDQTVNLEAETQQATEETKPEGEQQAEQAGDKPEGEQEQTERKRLSGAEKAKRRQTFLLNQLAEKDRELEALRQSRASEGEQAADKAPKEEDFPNDWGGYIAAKAAFEVKQSLKADASQKEASTRQAAQQNELRERVVEYEERADELRDVVKDFDKVISSVDIKIREELAREVLYSEKGPLLQYHLAQNPNELHRLNALGGRELAKEIGRLEATLKMPEAKKQTTAPPPVVPLKGGAQASFDPSKVSMDEYVAKRSSGWRG